MLVTTKNKQKMSKKKCVNEQKKVCKNKYKKNNKKKYLSMCLSMCLNA